MSIHLQRICILDWSTPAPTQQPKTTNQPAMIKIPWPSRTASLGTNGVAITSAVHTVSATERLVWLRSRPTLEAVPVSMVGRCDWLRGGRFTAVRQSFTKRTGQQTLFSRLPNCVRRKGTSRIAAFNRRIRSGQLTQTEQTQGETTQFLRTQTKSVQATQYSELLSGSRYSFPAGNPNTAMASMKAPASSSLTRSTIDVPR